MSSWLIQEPFRIPHMVGAGRPYRSSGRLRHGCTRSCLVPESPLRSSLQTALPGPHAPGSDGRQGRTAQGQSLQSREPAASQQLLHGSRGWIAGSTRCKQAPHWLALEVPPPGCTEPRPHWRAEAPAPQRALARCLHPAGVSARCLAPFAYELHLCRAKQTTEVTSSDYPVQTRPQARSCLFQRVYRAPIRLRFPPSQFLESYGPTISLY